MSASRLLITALAAGMLAAGAAHAAPVSSGPATPATAAHETVAPKPQAPGVYRFNVGDVRVTALSDGTVPLDLHQLLKGIAPMRIEQLLRRDFTRNPIETSINAYVIESGPRTILVDTGSGDLFGDNGGKLPASLRAAGYAPEQISDVLITHIHSDHSGGLVRGGRIAFLNATVHVAQADLDFFFDRRNIRDGLDPRYWDEAEKTVGPYRDAGQVRPFRGRTTILPGITAIPTPGHTPGHSFFLLQSKGERIEFWGDIMHVGAIQFPYPQATIDFDVSQPAARAQRDRQFREGARESKLVAAAHLAFPGVGHLRRERDGYQWVPLEYRNRD